MSANIDDYAHARHIEDYKGFRIPEGSGVIYEYFIPSICKSYIGQTVNLFARHASHAKRGRLRDYIEAGDYILNLLAMVPIDRLDRMERHYIHRLNTVFPNGLNKSIGGRDRDLISPDVDRNLAAHINLVFGDRDLSKEYVTSMSQVMRYKGGLIVFIPQSVEKKYNLHHNDIVEVTISPVWT